MDKLNEYVTAYYDACVANDKQKQQELLARLQELVVLLLTAYGLSNAEDIVSTIGIHDSQVKYEPSDDMIDRITADFREVLNGLSDRIAEERSKQSGVSEDELRKLVYAANLWQVKRIVDSQDHIIDSLSDVDIVDQLFHKQGYNVIKTWHATIDNRTCDVCKSMNGTAVSFTDNFVYNGDVIELDSHYSDFANAHPHCRCWIEYTLERS